MHPSPFRLLGLLAGVVLLVSRPASAQDLSQPWADPDDRPARLDVSASVGFLAPTDWSDLVLLGSISSTSGILEQVLVRDLRVKADKEYGGVLTYWRGRYGFRVQGGFSSSSVSIGGPLVGGGAISRDDAFTVDVDTYLYDVGGAIGFIDYTPELWAWPYGFVGIGGITYDLARRVSPPLFTFIERPGPGGNNRGNINIIDDDATQFVLAVDEIETETVFALTFGVGTDFRIPLGPAALGVRLEIADSIAESPVGLRIADLRRSGFLASDTGVEFDSVHHLRVGVGVVLQVGK